MQIQQLVLFVELCCALTSNKEKSDVDALLRSNVFVLVCFEISPNVNELMWDRDAHLSFSSIYIARYTIFNTVATWYTLPADIASNLACISLYGQAKWVPPYIPDRIALTLRSWHPTQATVDRLRFFRTPSSVMSIAALTVTLRTGGISRTKRSYAARLIRLMPLSNH